MDTDEIANFTSGQTPNQFPQNPEIPKLPALPIENQKRPPKIFLLVFVSIITLLGLLVFLFFPRNTIYAQAEALFFMYFEIDHVRADSAQIFAELLETQRSPERVDTEGQNIGDKSSLANQAELAKRIALNRNEVQTALDRIESEEFSAPEISQNHKLVKEYYQLLFNFEDEVVSQLNTSTNDQDYAVFVSNIFENESYWPAILKKDKEVRDSLQLLANSYKITFNNVSYEDAFKQELVNLDTPKLDNTQLGQAKYEFDIPDGFTQANVSVTIGPGADVTDLVYGLRHDDTGKVLNWMIKEAPREGEYPTILINELPRSDTGTNITADILPSEKYPIVNSNRSYDAAKIDYGESYLVVTLVPDDPILAPVHGDWTMFVLAPAGLEVVIGATAL